MVGKVRPPSHDLEARGDPGLRPHLARPPLGGLPVKRDAHGSGFSLRGPFVRHGYAFRGPNAAPGKYLFGIFRSGNLVA